MWCKSGSFPFISSLWAYYVICYTMRCSNRPFITRHSRHSSQLQSVHHFLERKTHGNKLSLFVYLRIWIPIRSCPHGKYQGSGNRGLSWSHDLFCIYEKYQKLTKNVLWNSKEVYDISQVTQIKVLGCWMIHNWQQNAVM